MKYLFIVSAIFCNSVKAQTANASLPRSENVVSFAVNLSEGPLLFTKTFRKNNADVDLYQVHYAIINPLYNNGAPMEVNLSHESFEKYFSITPRLSAVMPRILTYAEAMNIPFTNEKSWTLLFDFYNTNCAY